MTDLDRILNELGVIARPIPAPPPPAPPLRPEGPPHTWRGEYYDDGNIPF